MGYKFNKICELRVPRVTKVPRILKVILNFSNSKYSKL